MVKTQDLEARISNSGYRNKYLAEQLGITSNSFCNKVKGRQKFRIAEATVLSNILELSPDEKKDIFFADEVGVSPYGGENA